MLTILKFTTQSRLTNQRHKQTKAMIPTTIYIPVGRRMSCHALVPNEIFVPAYNEHDMATLPAVGLHELIPNEIYIPNLNPSNGSSVSEANTSRWQTQGQKCDRHPPIMPKRDHVAGDRSPHCPRRQHSSLDPQKNT